ncbi:MAG: LytTR family DNA-binding domain-containing protein [Cyclobacteriaceae bacterium]
MDSNKMSISDLLAYMKSESLLKKYLVVFILTIVSATLSTPIHFPFHPNYQFPFLLFFISLLDGIILVHLIDAVYFQFEKSIFVKKVEAKQIVWFILTCLTIISAYFPVYYFSANYLLGFTSELYSFVLSLLGSLLVVMLFIFLFYGRKFVELLTVKNNNGTFKVKSGKKIHLIPLQEIRYFYSQNKAVFLVNIDGKKMVTNFTLNELEGVLDKRIFFRANRQHLVQATAVASVSTSSNDKLEVTLKTNSEVVEIVVSRYKAAAFREWLEKATSHNH